MPALPSAASSFIQVCDSVAALVAARSVSIGFPMVMLRGEKVLPMDLRVHGHCLDMELCMLFVFSV